MLKSIKILKNFFSGNFCIYCGCSSVSSLGVCQFCLPLIIKQNPSLKLSDIKSRVLPSSLFVWRRGYGSRLAKLIYKAKTETNTQFWNEIVQLWLQYAQICRDYKSLQSYKMNIDVFIPIPSSTGRKHSLLLAEAFAKASSGLVCSCLQVSRKIKAEQKIKSRTQRNKIEFVCHERDKIEQITKEFAENIRWILVDDVLTTGASALAAQQALSLGSIELWCLAYRGNVAGNQSIC